MSEGKCEDCGKPTDMRDDGQPWKRCLDCGKAAKAKRFEKSSEQAKLPVRSAQEEAAEIYAVFRIFVRLVQADEPKIDATLGMQTALGLTQQFWSKQCGSGDANEQTP